jgi:hypothetical protein
MWRLLVEAYISDSIFPVHKTAPENLSILIPTDATSNIGYHYGWCISIKGINSGQMYNLFGRELIHINTIRQRASAESTCVRGKGST